MSIKTRWYKILIRFLIIIGIIGILTQVGGCGGSGGSSGSEGSGGSTVSSSNTPNNSGVDYSGLWSGGTIDQGFELTFNVEEIASYDITSMAFSVQVDDESLLQVTENEIIEPIEDNASSVHLQSGPYSIDIDLYFDSADQAQVTCSIYLTNSPANITDSPGNIIANGKFTATKMQGGNRPYYLAGPWSGTTNQGLKLAFNVEQSASYDITSIAFTVQVDGSDCNESFLGVTELGMAESIEQNASRVHIQSGPYTITIDFYFDFANQAHGTWSAYRTDSPDITFVGTFTAHKGLWDCPDGDFDGYHNYCGQEDCRPADPDIHPGATEICDDGQDNDCDDLIDCLDPDCFGTLTCCPNPTDADFDGFVVEAGCGTAVDCNDNDITINPGATEICNDMGDNDCDGYLNCNDPDCVGDPDCSGCTDSDADDFFAGAGCPQASDCNDNDDTIHPGATEICNNGFDDDCDGQIDEGCSNKTWNVPGDYGTIQAALDAEEVAHGDTVLVADGTYQENIKFSNTKAITLVSQNGPETTVIDGNQNGSVVTFEPDNNSTLNGFTITNGSAIPNGGGVFCGISSSPTITNCLITNNNAKIAGGGIHCASYSTPFITNSTIQNNSLTAVNIYASNGGGIHAGSSSTPTISNCIINNNTSNFNGGGLAFNVAFEPKIVNCLFSNNKAAVDGGAISFQNSSPEITNCTFSSNTADVNGGAISFQNSAPRITNCTFYSNRAPGINNAIACTNLLPGAVVTNSILWDNPDYEGSSEITVSGSRFLNVTYSNVKGGYCGVGNINVDPLFTGEGDYHLQAGSPCIDAGTFAGAPSTDIDGNARPAGAGFDMGADEYVP